MARVILSVLCGLLVPGLAGAQPATSAEVWRTPWGDPDLQGAWTNTTTTPFQRPFTDEERAELNARFTRGGERQANNATGAYNSFWLESGGQSAQETLINDARIIPLDGRAHLAPRIGQWLGDSRARWEGETLVVETTNFTSKADERALSATSGLPLVLGAGQHLRLVERFTRVDADTIDYAFTVTDPTTYAVPWSASIPMTALGGTLFEYACHEGNYGLLNILRGARARDGSR